MNNNDQIEKVRVFTNPMKSIELKSGESFEYPELMGMTKEIITSRLCNKFIKELGIEPENMASLQLIDEAFESHSKPDKIISIYLEVLSMILCKDKEWVEENVDIIDGVEVVTLFFSRRQKKKAEVQIRILESLGIGISSELPVENGDGVQKKQDKPRKK